jgi:3-(methylthio)propanoyl-CoA dehydrogenase
MSAENFYTDNPDLRFRLEQIDLSEVVAVKENGYRFHGQYPTAPRSYADAIENYSLMLEVLGEICANVIAPQAAQADEEGAVFDKGEVTYSKATNDALEALRQAELMGAMLPWEFGGLNLPETVYGIMVEMISRAEAGLMTIFGLQEIAASINEVADDEIKKRILPKFARGEVTGAMVLTEPDAGSDLGSVQTKAVFDEATGLWRISGVKRFITNGCADIQLVLARSEEGTSDARGLSLFLLERDETVRIRRIENKMGMHSSPTCEIQYNGTPAYLVGKRRFGLLRYAMALMNGARLAVGAQAIGIAEAAYREAYRYASARIQFDRPIRDLPAVSRMLLSMCGEIEAGRALLFETGRWVDSLKAYDQLLAESVTPDPAVRQKQKQASNLADTLTPLTKYYNTEMGNRVCFLAMQVHGGVGYMQEFNIERHFRDVRVTNIYEGTSQLQVVAATGKLLGHALDSLYDAWAVDQVGEELAPLKAHLVEAVDLFKRATDSLKERQRDIIDYYAVDLVDMACYLLNSWLLLRDGKFGPRKLELAKVYIAEHLPEIHRAGEAILAADATPLQAREKIFGKSSTLNV